MEWEMKMEQKIKNKTREFNDEDAMRCSNEMK